LLLIGAAIPAAIRANALVAVFTAQPLLARVSAAQNQKPARKINFL